MTPDEDKILKKFHNRIRRTLKEGGVNSPDLEARIIFRDVLGISDADMIAGHNIPISEDQKQSIRNIVQRRLGGEPLSLIRGFKEFWGLEFKVTGDVLDPRPDSETLVETVLAYYKDSDTLSSGPSSILDLGTGTGCLAITLLKEFPKARAIATDISDKALRIARENAETHDVTDRIRFVKSRWCDEIDEIFDLVVSNPPYIPLPVINTLESAVKNHDPILALDGGHDGLEAYRSIVTEIKGHIHPGSRVFFEIGISQESDIKRIVENAGLEVVNVHPDLGGIPRVVEISAGEN